MPFLNFFLNRRGRLSLPQSQRAKKVFLAVSLSAPFILSALFILSASFAQAEDLTSTNFILRDPVITVSGGRSTATSFEFFSSSGQTAPGESTSTNFIYRAGFLYFPTANSPVISATAGNGQISLSWTASVGTLANITNYQLGTATVSGGPYTFESLGNVLSFTKTSLTNGTVYYFKIKADAGTLTLAQSAEASATPAVSTSVPNVGGGGSVAPAASVKFSGIAYPKSTVILLKDAQIAATTVADDNANFQITLAGLSSGNYIFMIYAKDNQGRSSPLLIFPESINSGAITKVEGIFIPPTIAADKEEVKKGNNIAIFGQSAPDAEISIIINSNTNKQFFAKTKANKAGNYLYNFNTNILEMGQYAVKSQASLNGMASSSSKSVSFLIGKEDILAKPTEGCPVKADLNNDCNVNLVDISILIYWFDSPTVPPSIDLNGDAKADLTDLSILAYYWTG